MFLESERRRVAEFGRRMSAEGLSNGTSGNLSVYVPEEGYMVLSPSGMRYEDIQPEDVVVMTLDGKVAAGGRKPSSEWALHAYLYREKPEIRGVVHTHSRFAASLAQAERDLPCYGTTHADYFYGAVPCTRHLTEAEITEDYEGNTGKVIVETFRGRGIDPMAVPAVLVCKHGPFTWGKTCAKAVENALVLEECAHMARLTEQFAPGVAPAPSYLQDKHYFRKHGPNAYYGQK